MIVGNCMASKNFCALEINLAIGFIRKPIGMHWLNFNDAVPWLNEEYFGLQSILKILKLICISSVCQPACWQIDEIQSPTR